MRQYQDDSNLAKRISIYQFGENPVAWADWYFQHLPVASARHILDIGCGNASIWVGREDLLGEDATVELADQSQGMIEAARARLGNSTRKWVFRVASVEHLPYETASFDIVMANHMLYHTADMPAAVSELARVVKPGGCVFASTNGMGHMRQLREWAAECGLSPVADKFRENADVFGLENGPAILGERFGRVFTHYHRNSLWVPEVEPVIDYIRSLQPVGAEAQIASLRARLSAEISKRHGLRIDLDTGLVEARLPKPIHHTV